MKGREGGDGRCRGLVKNARETREMWAVERGKRGLPRRSDCGMVRGGGSLGVERWVGSG